MSDLVVVKYGGSVLKGADSFRDAASYAIGKNADSTAVVLPSAMDPAIPLFVDTDKLEISAKVLAKELFD